MTTYILVSGAWHGSWCWSEVAPLLERAGHRVLTPDLAEARSGSPDPIDQPSSRWADQIAAMLRAETDPVVLVGHSRAGITISEAAERVPEKVGLLIYLTAFLLRDGQTLQEVARQADNAATFGAAIGFDRGMLHFSDGDVHRLLYNGTPDHLVQLARKQLAPEPAAAHTTPIRVTDERFGTVPRAYIECSDDQAIPLATQRSMQAALPCAIVERLESDHSPFFSMPTELVEAFGRCVGRHAATRTHAPQA